ncbi:MAG: hypothetical protein PG979_001511 [Rickettsia asembonensis]|nr:MAG: hypothetical protein PG979_001511 [Rickettsia asembonensis]
MLFHIRCHSRSFMSFRVGENPVKPTKNLFFWFISPNYVTSISIFKLFFSIPAYAGMTLSRFFEQCNNAVLTTGSRKTTYSVYSLTFFWIPWSSHGMTTKINILSSPHRIASNEVFYRLKVIYCLKSYLS